ncbi:transcriptional regulator family: Fungal Specific TF [Purpureocillium lilacinum]|uniref:Transcriptional regulator family: Fungal Specific TF n=1 Tax=Purpureocillium lilacinum TaxID=33203 RepID=A0ABR0BN20_PURLI|nr:transcriptional regulator family: Fungal Specific TF [Purpureocillium lilacinum]
MRASDSDLRYVGGDHWAAILDSITDLRDHLDRDEQFRLVGDGSDPAQNEASVGESANGLPRWRSPHAMLLYGASRPTSRADVLAALPPKVVVDRYVARYFNSLELASCIVHGPTFLKEYEAFWANPSSVPIMWIGLLFSIIGLAVVTSDTTDNSTNNSINSGDIEQQALRLDLYREKTVQCLISGEYTNAGPHALETILHYLHIEFAARADADRDAWLLLALAVNLALRAGYHRDPDHFPGMRMSALQREMRRRVWATVLQADVLISTQMGMPRMVADSRWDAAEPKNYNDADLEPDAMELPPPRPETEFTTSLGIIARRRMLLAVGTISDIMSATASCSYADVMNADSLLHDAAASIPPPLKPKSLAASITDSPQLITGRLFISHVFHKGQIMLHRRFLHAQSPSSERDAFAYSRKACLDASLETLQIQHILDEETRPGGQLHSMRWRLSSIMNHQFLTATMILARATWTRGSARSREAKRAAETVNFVLARAVGSGNGLDAGKGVDTGTLVDGTDQSTMSTLFEDMGEYDTGPWFDRQDMDLMLQEEDFGLFQPNGFIMPTL